MNMSSEIDQLASALVEAQKELQPAPFDSEVKFKSVYYRYSSLGSVIETAKVLAKHGIAYSNFPVSEGWYVGTDNILMHKSGQWISQRVLFPMNQEASNPVQEAGRIISYSRRYGLSAMVGIYSEEDVDAINQDQASGVQGTSDSPSARPYGPEELKIRISEISEDMRPASEKQLTLLASKLAEHLPDEDIRHNVQEYLFGERSLKDCDPKLINAGLKWINLDENYQVAEVALKELSGVQSAFLISKGQRRLDEVVKKSRV